MPQTHRRSKADLHWSESRLTSIQDGISKLWSLTNFEYKATLVGATDQIACADHCKEHDSIIVGSWDSEVRFYPLSPLPEPHNKPLGPSYVASTK